jgi:pentatricopeptide repeat protein
MTYAIAELSPDEGFSMMRGHEWNPTTQELNAFLNDALKSNNFTAAFNIIREAAKEPAIPLDAASYAMLIDAQVKANHIDEAFELFKEMHNSSVAPDTVVYTTLLDACARSHDYMRARTLFDGMLASDANVRPNIYSYNIILSMLARKGDLTEAQHLIDTMPTHGVLPDIRSYNTLLTIYATNKNTKGAWQLYEKMCKQSITPDRQTFASLMELSVACNDLAFGERVLNGAFTNLTGRQYHRIIAPMTAQLMQLYLKANQAAKAQTIWQQLRNHNITPNQHCIAAVLQACIQQGHLSTAHTIWKQLGEEEVELRDRALTAYANVLLVEERWDDMLNVFKLMENIPSDETLVPFLDKLRDAGRVEEANELLRSSRSTTIASRNNNNNATDYSTEVHPRSRTQKDKQYHRNNNSNYRQRER